VILNLDEIQALLTDAFPEATIEQTDMNGWDFMRQATWWNGQDVIIIAHGAAVTNCIFMERNATIVEIIPDELKVHFFDKLALTAGLRHKRIERDTTATEIKRNPRNVDLIANETLVLPIVREALLELDNFRMG
jgi:capsular polysaccharide biosynthesis protein